MTPAAYARRQAAIKKPVAPSNADKKASVEIIPSNRKEES
jgi:hypothetical protein